LLAIISSVLYFQAVGKVFYMDNFLAFVAAELEAAISVTDMIYVCVIGGFQLLNGLVTTVV